MLSNLASRKDEHARSHLAHNPLTPASQRAPVRLADPLEPQYAQTAYAHLHQFWPAPLESSTAVTVTEVSVALGVSS